MSNNRTGEQGNVPTRNDRVFKKSSYWYYTTREGVDIGPFDNQADAELGATEFIDYVSIAQPKVIAALQQHGKHAA